MSNEYTCVICNQQVSRRKSYAIPNKGRACKIHEEARQEAQQVAEMRRLEVRKAMQEKFKEKSSHFPEFRDPWSFCWHCQKSAISNQIISSKMLGEMLAGKVDLLSADPWENIRKQIGDKVVIRDFLLPEDFPEWKIRQLCPRDRTSFETALLGHIIILCVECAQEFKFDWEKGTP